MSQPSLPPPPPEPPKPLTEMPQKGAAVYLFSKRPSGTWKHQAAIVIDTNDHVKAVRVEYSVTSKKRGVKWVELAELTLQPEPTKGPF